MYKVHTSTLAAAKMSHSGGSSEGAPDRQTIGMDTIKFRNSEQSQKRESSKLNSPRTKRDNPNTSKKNLNARKYMKEATVKINDINIDVVGAMAVITAVEDICGVNTVLAVVPDKDRCRSYEVTMDKIDNAYKLSKGINIVGNDYECTLIKSETIVVSFLHIPAYVEDEELLAKLTDKNIEIVSPVFRRTYAHTDVADGTRYVRVKFPPGMVSLAWSMAFDTSEGRKYFKVVHNHQMKVCSNCFSPDHLYKNCPEFCCRGCGEQGHKIKECNALKCRRCHKLPLKCKCRDKEPEMENQQDDEEPTNSQTRTEFNEDGTYADRGNENYMNDNDIDFEDLPDYSEFTGCKYCRRQTCICTCTACERWYNECICEDYDETESMEGDDYDGDSSNIAENDDIDTEVNSAHENLENTKQVVIADISVEYYNREFKNVDNKEKNDNKQADTGKLCIHSDGGILSAEKENVKEDIDESCGREDDKGDSNDDTSYRVGKDRTGGGNESTPDGNKTSVSAGRGIFHSVDEDIDFKGRKCKKKYTVNTDKNDRTNENIENNARSRSRSPYKKE